MKKIAILTLIVALFFSLITIPIMAQSNVSETNDLKQPVVVDGRELFDLYSYELFPAQLRANLTNSEIQAAIESEETPQVRVEERNQSPIIILNERYLLTVTEQDTLPGVTPKQQANIWANRISESVKKAQKERTKSYILRRLLFSVIILIGTIAFHWFLGRIWQKSHPFWRRILQIENSDSTSPEFQTLKLFLNLSLLLIRISLWTFVILYLANLFPLTRVWSYRISDSLISGFSSPVLNVGNNSYSLIDFFILIGLLIVLFFIANTLSNLLRTRVLNLTQINRGIQEAITFVAKYIMIFIGSIVLLQVWGFDLSSLTIFASAVGVAIGFGFQDIAKNFGSGLVLLFERPISVGDFVEVSDYMGVVENIGARSTLIRTLDQVSIIIPNSRFLEEEVINWSHHNPVSRLHLPVGVSYSSDVQIVRTALLEATKDCSDILKYPTPQVLFKGFGDSSVDFELLVWIRDPSKQILITSELYFAIEASFKGYDIEIPFPQRDLHLRSGELPLQFSSDLENFLTKILNKNK